MKWKTPIWLLRGALSSAVRLVFGSSARNLASPRPPANVLQIYAKVIAAPTAALQ